MNVLGRVTLDLRQVGSYAAFALPSVGVWRVWVCNASSAWSTAVVTIGLRLFPGTRNRDLSTPETIASAGETVFVARGASIVTLLVSTASGTADHAAEFYAWAEPVDGLPPAPTFAVERPLDLTSTSHSLDIDFGSTKRRAVAIDLDGLVGSAVLTPMRRLDDRSVVAFTDATTLSTNGLYVLGPDAMRGLVLQVTTADAAADRALIVTCAGIDTESFRAYTESAGDLVTMTEHGAVSLPIGADTHVLTVDTALPSKVKWAASGGGGGGITHPQVMARGTYGGPF